LTNLMRDLAFRDGCFWSWIQPSSPVIGASTPSMLTLDQSSSRGNSLRRIAPRIGRQKAAIVRFTDEISFVLAFRHRVALHPGTAASSETRNWPGPNIQVRGSPIDIARPWRSSPPRLVLMTRKYKVNWCGLGKTSRPRPAIGLERWVEIATRDRTELVPGGS